jgi:hypothetical protein
MESEFRTVYAYVKAVSGYWWAILTGLVLTVLDGVERLFGTWYRPPLWAKLTTGIAGFVVAQYLAYRDLAHNAPNPTNEFNQRLRILFRDTELRWSMLDRPDSFVTPQTICKHVDDFHTRLMTLYSQCPPSLDSQPLRDVIEKLQSTNNFRLGNHVGSKQDADRICELMKVAIMLRA